jgi:DNA polymerase-3 subunit delta
MAAELKPVYLLWGSDRPKVTRALQRLRSRFPADASERLSAADANGEDAVAACNARGLFGEGERLVEVGAVDQWKAADAKAIAAYLAAPAPGTVLALVAGDLKRDSPLAKACAKAGDLLAYDVVKKRLPEWVAEQFGRLGATADPAACRALVELVGDNLDELATEVDKLATWAGDEEIGVAEVEALAAGRAEVPYFTITDALGRRDQVALLSACESVLEQTQPRSRAVPALVGRLAAHVGRLRACQTLEDEGVRPRDAAGRLKMHPFAAEKAFEQARNYTPEELRRAVVRLARLDLALKGKSRLSSELELERALVDIVTRPERAPGQEA